MLMTSDSWAGNLFHATEADSRLVLKSQFDYFVNKTLIRSFIILCTQIRSSFWAALLNISFLCTFLDF